MKKKIKYPLIIFGCILLIFGCLEFIRIFGHFAGSYPYAEYYKFNISRNELINRINHFKEDNPQYILVTSNEKGELRKFQDKKIENFYVIYFYMQDIDMTLHCIINTNGNDKPTSLGFNSVSKGVNFGSWQRVNSKDLPEQNNKEIKKKIETEILDKLGSWQRE